ncbi:GNAT family N-acetyltransferase [Thalassotalea insulae]|uniref:GNAT family N-acetyltransferase n=1 Tax=Thalassotalea insulae TaxID=2056778 RepID=A0ABQ6GQ37_9GAMM|nr:bifunctional GNAT family N-acetyltransferase/hotdog fold thioesterase [Thalassotalea insulae]GLX78083.1 GNAT family N-acetyltransferase [Thalassotalea insulae]
MIECRAPKTKEEFQQYYQLRWQLLRKPWQQPEGSEQDQWESQSIHRAVFEQQQIVAVGRLHFINQYQAQIRYMAVSDAALGKGYGKLLINALEYQAQLRGARKITLEAREISVGFYQHHNYLVLAKSHLLFQQIKHFTMEKTLSPLASHLGEQARLLQNTWHSTIPMSKAMNIAISYYDGSKLATHCEPLFNKNLHNTMFAGSIYTLATLTGWGWVYLQLANNHCQGDIVLADASIKYIAPVAGVASGQTNNEVASGECAPLLKQQKARFNVEVNIYSGDKVAAKFTGKYVVIPKDE